MIARPKISRNERKTAEIGAFEVGNFAPFCCPGFGAGKGVFFRNLETLAVDARRRVLAFDWLGQGCSDRPGGFPARPTPLARETSSDDDVADGAVAWFTDSLEAWRRRVLPAGAPFTLVAHSVGGFLAAHYALRHPGAVDRLVLVSPAGVPRHPEGLDDDAVDAALAAAARPRYACFSYGRPLVALWDYHVTPQSLIRLLGDQSRRARPVVKHLYRRAGDVPDAFADYLYNINALPGSSERVLTTLFKPADRDDALRGIYARRALVDDPRAPSLPPTTVLYGERDWMLNGLTERAVADLGAELVLVPDAGHQIHLENPEACNAAILAAVGSGAAREARVG
jgi:cardiolipin-specific phospholipase